MRRNLALVTLLVLQVVVAALSLVFHTRVRVSVLDAFQAYDTAIPRLTRLALSPWLMPVALAAAAALDAAAIALPLRRPRRAALAAAGLVASSSALIFAVCAAFVPVFAVSR